jgi:hypothetical protein
VHSERSSFDYTKLATVRASETPEGMVGTRSKPRMGRPPRADRPEVINARVPGELRRWLRSRARVEQRTQSDLLAAAIEAYRERVTRRGKP